MEAVAFFIPGFQFAQAGFRAAGAVFQVGGDGENVQTVDAVELFLFGQGCAGHAAQLAVHTEVVLDGDGGVGHIFRLDFHAFLGFHRLVQPVGPASSGHHAAGKLIHNNDFTVLDNVFLVSAEEECRPQGLFQEVFNIFFHL
ncbi:MAG: hypothetical protein BWY09_03207 [Candidatus Hydrogenedentes bacterium ADurb.Bin179]|nr:MAG: hypothetical protein BWY09_03207 [Candidatus Hydrogenedentes bacterium ADurb.Bin179]